MEALRDSLLMIQSMQRDGMLTAEEVRFSVCVHVNSNGRGRRDPGTGKCSNLPAAVRLWDKDDRAGVHVNCRYLLLYSLQNSLRPKYTITLGARAHVIIVLVFNLILHYE